MIREGEEDLGDEDEDLVEEELRAAQEEEEEEEELERYLRDVNQSHRARTAPLRAKNSEQHFKLTPGFS